VIRVQNLMGFSPSYSQVERQRRKSIERRIKRKKMEEKTEKKYSTDSWDNFLGSSNFLKAEDVEADQKFVCVEAEVSDDNRPRLLMQSGEDDPKMFDLNVTNSNTTSDAGVKSPKDCVGKTFVFKKALVMSPKTKKEVETLRIKSIA